MMEIALNQFEKPQLGIQVRDQEHNHIKKGIPMKTQHAQVVRQMFLVGAVVAVIGGSANVLGGAVMSTFDAGLEGWVVADFPDAGPWTSPLATYPANSFFSPSGGNPGGYLLSSDPSGNTFFLQAPSQFLGNKFSAYGTSLSFDMYHLEAVNWDPGVDVVLVGAGMTLVRGGVVTPTPSWQTFQVPLTETGWQISGPGGAAPTSAEFQSVLAGLSELEIRGEFFIGPDTTGLDNVSLVPEPGEWAMMAGVGLLGFSLWRRRSVK